MKLLIAGMLLLVTTGCRKAKQDMPDAKIDSAYSPMRVCASIAPLAFAVKAVGGERVSVSTLLAPGQSPATYEPTSKQMVELSKAKCLFAVGVPFEAQVVASVSSSLPDLNVVDASVGIKRREADFKCNHENAAEHTKHHAHQLDPHIWMNPRLMLSIAETIHVELCTLDPGGRALFEERFAKLKRSLDALDSQIKNSLAPLKNRAFYVYHPSLGYFAKAYGLEQIAIEQSGKAPTAKELNKLIKRARSEGVKLIFVQPQFSQRAARSVAQQIGGAVVALDPLAENYIENLTHIADQIKTALSLSPSDTPGHIQSAGETVDD